MRILILLLLSTVVLISCQKVIDIKPSTGEEKVIIQGNLFTDSIATVVVTKSTAFLSTTAPQSIATASVILSDNIGNTEIMVWNPTFSRYESATLKGVVNSVYTLNVTLDGKTYKSSSKIIGLDPVDSISFRKVDAGGFREEGYYMDLYASIPTNIDKFYIFKGYADGVILDEPTEINLVDNRLISSNSNSFDAGYKYEANEVAKLEVYSLTEAAYKFYEAARLQLNNDGGFFSTPPANVPSMFDNGAIGLFQCSDVNSLTKTVVEQ